MAAVEIIFSPPLGYLAGQVAVVIISGVIEGVTVLAAAGLEAGADLGGQLIDAVFDSRPRLGAPAPHDNGGGWLS